jgi:hypothetical protein
MYGELPSKSWKGVFPLSEMMICGMTLKNSKLLLKM